MHTIGTASRAITPNTISLQLVSVNHESVSNFISLFCPTCSSPTSSRVRMLPCHHVICNTCSEDVKKTGLCLLCGKQVRQFEWLNGDSTLHFCQDANCMQAFLNPWSLTFHQKVEHNLQRDLIKTVLGASTQRHEDPQDKKFDSADETTGDYTEPRGYIPTIAPSIHIQMPTQGIAQRCSTGDVTSEEVPKVVLPKVIDGKNLHKTMDSDVCQLFKGVSEFRPTILRSNQIKEANNVVDDDDLDDLL